MLFDCFAVRVHNVTSIFSTKYLTCLNDLEMLDMQFDNSPANLVFDFSSFDRAI